MGSWGGTLRLSGRDLGNFKNTISARVLHPLSCLASYDSLSEQIIGIAAVGGEGLAFTYDGFLQTGTTWTGTVSGSVSCTYDSNFWVTSTSVNGAHAATFAYDNDGLLTQADDLAIARDASNGFIAGTTAATIADTWTYNGYCEPASYTATGASGDLYAVAYTRDALGRITQKAETIAGDQMTWDYGHDTAGRLTTSTLTTPGGIFPTTYTYDANGNRLSKTGQFGTETGAYDAQDRMTAYGDCTYAYTANGELSAKTCGTEVTSYTYDDFGNLTHVTMPDGITIDYVIDARNRRVGKKVNGVLVQGFLYGDQLNPVAELDGSGAVVARFVYGTKPNVPDYMVKGGVTYRYVTDQLGSVRLVVDAATGAVAQRIDYDEYGVVIQRTNPDFQPFGFAGGITDTHTGLVRFGARDYDPASGRWTSEDPVGFNGSLTNFYSYSLFDPVNHADASGLECDRCITFSVPNRGVLSGGIGRVIAHKIGGYFAARLEFKIHCPHNYPRLTDVGLESRGNPPYSPAEHRFPEKWQSNWVGLGGGTYRTWFDVPSRTALIDPNGVQRVRVWATCCCK